jgi:hypothetical protein
MTVPHVIFARRGCGVRKPGFYAESAPSVRGKPLTAFLIDPPAPVPAGFDLVNKAQVWRDPTTGIPHLWSWIGEIYYPYVWDIIAEIDDLGASRRVSPITPGLETLIPGRSRLILVHPRCLNALWREQQAPEECEKHVVRHDLAALEREGIDPLLEPERREGPCLFQTRGLIPRQAAHEVEDGVLGGLPLCRRTIGSTTYSYFPTGESDAGLGPGCFIALPLTGFALVQDAAGNVHQGALESLQKAHFPYYLSQV